MNVFIKFIRLFHRQLLHRRIYFWTLFIVFIVMAFVDNNQGLIYALHDIMYRYTEQQAAMVFIPILLVPICLNESFQDLNDRLFCIYSPSKRLPTIALWVLLTAVCGFWLSLGVWANKELQMQFFEIPGEVWTSYLVTGWMELAGAFGIYIGMFRIFKRIFVTDIVYFFLLLFLLFVPSFLPFPGADLISFPLIRHSMELLQDNPGIVIGSRAVYLVLAVALMFWMGKDNNKLKKQMKYTKWLNIDR